MKRYLYLVCYVIEYIFIYFFIQTIFNLLIMFYVGKNIGTSNINNIIFQYSTKSMPIVIVLTFVIYYLLFKVKQQNLIKYCDLYNEIDKKHILPIVFFMVGFGLIISSSAEFSGIYSIKKSGIFESIVAITFIPVFEEVLFRGIIFNKLRENMESFTAIIVQAVIFGLFHANLFQIIYSVILGIMLCLIYARSNSIWESILGHAFFNLFGLVIMPRVLKPLVGITIITVPICIIIGVVVLIFSLKSFYRITRKKVSPFSSFFIQYKIYK